MCKILLADDCFLARIDIKTIMRERFKEHDVHTVEDGYTALSKCRSNSYDLLIVGGYMPNTEAIILISSIRIHVPHLKMLIFGLPSTYIYIRSYLTGGPNGFLNMDAEKEEVLIAIDAILKGRSYYDRELLESIADTRVCIKPENYNPFEILTERELDIALRLVRGDSTGKIAKSLHIQVTTVASHKFRIFEKLNLDNSVALVNLARMYPLPIKCSVSE